MPLRYAGGKKKTLKPIISVLKRHFETGGREAEYREPFFGGGSVGLSLLEICPEISRAWFNDRDPSVCAIWESIARRGQEFLDLIHSFDPHVDRFYEFRDELASVSCVDELGDRLDAAFKKLACHRMSYSGLGTAARADGRSQPARQV